MRAHFDVGCDDEGATLHRRPSRSRNILLDTLAPSREARRPSRHRGGTLAPPPPTACEAARCGIAGKLADDILNT